MPRGKSTPAGRRKEKGGAGGDASKLNNRKSGDPAAVVNWKPVAKDPRRWFFIALFIAVAAGGSWLVSLRFRETPVPVYTYRVVAEYPHDPTAFTQGLWIDDQGFVLESAGQYGKSVIRKSVLATGEIVQEKSLPENYFAEGLTYFQGRFYQLTWRERRVLVYDDAFNLLEEVEYDGDGWGLTHDEQHLILSDGTAKLRFIDPQTMRQVHSVWVTQGRQYITRLNELEKIGKKVYANRLDTDLIYDIDPATGQVNSIIDLQGLWPYNQRPSDGVLNGIAFNPVTKRMVVTGKYCPRLYELELVLKE